MNLQDMGALGESISAIAVLVTLVYISVQTRQSRTAAEETAKFAGLQATHSIIDLYVAARRSLLAHSETIARANRGEEMSDSERYTLSIVFHDLFFGAAYSHLSAVSGGAVHPNSGDVEYILHLLSDNPCAVAEWHRLQHIVEKMDSEFVASVARGLGDEVEPAEAATV